MHLHVAATYDNGVRLKWTIAPSCYNRKTTTLQYQSSDGQKFSFNISNDIDWVDLTGLDSDTSYNLTFVTKYKGGEVSDPVLLSFKTNESSFALTGGAIAGIAIGKNTLFFERFALNLCEKNLFFFKFPHLICQQTNSLISRM